jgi:signal transduction histidine kinase
MCIQVIKGEADPKLPYFSEGGSFYMNATTRFLATVSEEEKGPTRNVCNEFGYESVALVPLKLGEKILGLIHVADPSEGMVPLRKVVALEEAALQLATALQRIEAENRLREAHEELKKAYLNLERAQATAVASEKLAALGRLTAGVTHEILNPMNVITLRLHMMITDPEVSGKIKEDLKDMQEQANRIIRISRDLLYFARQRHPERAPVDVNAVLVRTLGLLEHDLRIKNIHVEKDLEEGLPQVDADQDQISQVIFNILTNARDIMPKGGRLYIASRQIEERGIKVVEIRIEDTGPGIPEEIMGKIFDPFFTTKPEGEGTGLGLSICQGIVEAHGGRIWAENLPQGGAAFIIRLPVEAG